tara:strand:+ start:77 stop:382 length:306 start_codon:yes stop_codon:yes gene_type:complete
MSELSAEHEVLKGQLDEILEELRNVNRAFPRDLEGRADHEGHRKYHESLIRSAEAQEQFWKELRLDVAKKGTWALMVILLGLFVLGVATKLGLSTAAIGSP